MCTWKGLPEGETCLRVDIVRHFECVPRTAIKDLMSLHRPAHNEEALKLASRLGPVVPNMHSSTLAAADTVKSVAVSEFNAGG